jgi:hypothetical protein
MKKIFLAILLFLGTSYFYFGCKHDPVIPKHTICFESEVLPVIVSNCARSGCHDASSGAQGYNFSDYNGIMEAVNPGNPGKSSLYQSIKGTIESIMPPSPSAPLTSVQIQTIKMWIEQGAENTTNCENNGTNGCDSINVTYSGTIQPLLGNYCVGCHNSGTASGNANLDGYTNVKSYLDAHKSNFVNAINYNSSIKMPPSGKLSDCNIAKFIHWINNSYPNN